MNTEQGLKTFVAGIHPPYNKELAAGKPIKGAPVPAEVIIPLAQHVGAPNSPVVNVGDRVTVGQKLGGSDAFVSAPVHSSVSGTVKAIEEVNNFAGSKVQAVVITADASQPEFAGERKKPVDQLTSDEIRAIAKDAGLVGMGGAAFPTHVKLTPPKNKPVDVVIINGCECEPYLTCDHRLMMERPKDLIEGLKLLMKAVGAERGIIGVEVNKMDAIGELSKALSGEENLAVELLDVKYPEGSEKQLIFATTGKKVPPGKLPSEVGCLVQNVGTAIALYEAATTGKPLFERVLTVTGPGVMEPSNLLTKVGTPISALIDACGGPVGDPVKIIMGGPMTGWAQEEPTASVVKGTSGVLLFTEDMVDVREERACVRCGKCVDVCPMFLMPSFIVTATQDENWEKAELWGVADCFECGCCSYTCPAYIPHVQYVRKAKAEIAAAKRE